MSNFLPDNISSPSSGKGSTLTPAISQSVSDKDIELAARVASAFAARPQQLLGPLMAYIADAISVSNLLLPISQVIGFTSYTARYSSADGTESTTSETYTTLDGGPTLEDLPTGAYAILWGARCSAETAGTEVLCIPEINSVTPSTAGCSQSSANASHVARAGLFNLDQPTNTVTVVYSTRDAAVAGHWDNRWLLTLKYANL